MIKYDFSAINDNDFEALACDVIGRELNTRIERFKPGKDKGVDGRFYSIGTHEEVVLQAKHYVKTDFKGLLRSLRLEVPKLIALKVKRYILCVSNQLSRANKLEISEIFSGFILSEIDIYGREDLNDLLSKHKDVELRFHGLWMTSAVVLERIINSGIFGRSDYQQDKIRQESRLYVETQDFYLAGTLLDEKHAIIISGAPGIGKTTLAHMLCLKYINSGYRFVCIDGDISEAESVFGESKERTIFYFDDFLGRNFYEAVHAKDSAIVNFIKRVEGERLKRFILTSRTNILNQGKHLIDQFGILKIEKTEYEIKVGNLSTIDKGKILYSHLWNSGLSSDMLDEIYKDKRYIQIIRHSNFNPRVISHIVDTDRMQSINSHSYWSNIQKILDNPSDIWDHCWSVQIDQNCRDIVSLVSYNGHRISESDLKSAYFRLRHASGKLSVTESAQDYRIAVKICVGSLLNRTIEGKSSDIYYDLFNPSIGDYIVSSNFSVELAGLYIRSLSTEKSINYLETILNAGRVNIFACEIILNDALVSAQPHLSDNYKSYISNFIISKSADRRLINFSVELLSTTVISELKDDGLDHYLNSISILSEKDLGKLNIGAICSDIVSQINLRVLTDDNYKSISRLITNLPRELSEIIMPSASQSFSDYWSDKINSYVIDNNIASEFYDHDDSDEVESKISETVYEIVTEYAGAWLDAKYIDCISCSCSASDIIEHNIAVSTNDEDSGSGRWSSVKQSGDIPDSQIDDIFDRNR